MTQRRSRAMVLGRFARAGVAVVVGVVGVGVECGAAVRPPAAAAPARPEIPSRAVPGRGTAERAPVQQVKTVAIELVGDLDCMQVAREVGRAFRGAAEDGVAMVVLEMGGNRWRGDVVYGVAQAITGYRMGGEIGGRRPVVMVLLNDPTDKRVGTGQAALGVLVDACVIGPGMTIGLGEGEELEGSTPAGVSAEDADRQVRAMVYAAGLVRGADELVQVLLPTASQALWIASTPGAGKEAKLLADPAKGAPGAKRIAMRKGSGESAWMELDAETARKIGVVTGVGTTLGPVYAERNIRAAPMTRVTVASGLSAARLRVRQGLGAQEAVRAGIDMVLDKAEKYRGDDAPALKRAAGAESAPMIEQALAELGRVEALTKEYPELLAELPPGVTPVAQAASKLATAWRGVFQAAQDKLAALRERARRLASEVK